MALIMAGTTEEQWFPIWEFGGSPLQQPGSNSRLQVLGAGDVRLNNLVVQAGGVPPPAAADSLAARVTLPFAEGDIRRDPNLTVLKLREKR